MYVIFDMDGVIADSEIVYLDGYMHAAEIYNLPKEEMREAVARATGVTDERERAIMEETFGHLPQFDVEKTYRACREYFNHIIETGQMKLKPGAQDILRFLGDRNIPTGLASSSPRPRIEKVLGPHNILQYFTAVVSGDMVLRSKPDPEIFRRCAERLAIPESEYRETFVIEDSYNGIRAASAAGMRPVMVPDRLPPTEEMHSISAAVLPSLTDVMEWLENERKTVPGSV